MIVKSVEVAQLRGYEFGQFEFVPGINLIVGINGAGKSTILNALRIGLMNTMPRVSSYRSKKDVFEVDDIRLNAETLTVSLNCEIDGSPVATRLIKFRADRDNIVVGSSKDFAEAEDTQFRVEYEDSSSHVMKEEGEPVAIYFSTRRSHPSKSKATSTSTGRAAAHNRSLVADRDFNTVEIADFLRALEVLGEEDQGARIRFEAMQLAADRFLPDYGRLIVQREKKGNVLLIEKGEDVIPVKWLSDGERSMLCLALDIAKRLALANTGLQDPIREGRAIVLVDELDMHLHPKWQRLVVERLTETFPGCQFIATTHSPQLIGEVKAERIIVISNEGVYRPAANTFGADASRVLEEVMGTKARKNAVDKMMTRLFREIDDENVSAAKAMLKTLIDQVGDSDPEVLRAQTLLTFIED